MEEKHKAVPEGLSADQQRLNIECIKGFLGMDEKDPLGKGQHEPGAKLDAGKQRPWLVLGGFKNALKEVTKVGTYGSRKYSERGWMHVPDADDRYLDAVFRHLLADEDCDRESGLPHLAHAAWGLLAVLELRMRGV